MSLWAAYGPATFRTQPHSPEIQNNIRNSANNILSALTQQVTGGSRFATVRFTTIHFYGPFPVGPSTPYCGASLSQLKRPFSTHCASSAFPVCTCFFFFYFSAVLLSWLSFFHPWRPSKRQKRRRKPKQLTLHSVLMSSEPRPGPSTQKWFDWYIFFFNYLCNFLYI